MAGYASKESIRFAALGLVAIVAISMAAASITVAVGPAGGPTSPGEAGGLSQDRGNNNNGESGSGNLADGDSTGEASSYQFANCIRFLAGPFGTLGYFGLFGGILYGIKRRYNVGTALLGMYAMAPFVLVAYFTQTNCATAGGPGVGEGGAGGAASGLVETGVASPEVSPIVLVGVMAFVIVAAGAVLYRVSGDQSVVAEEFEEEGVEQPDVADLAAAAGRAADRMAQHDADVDNEVYRAWWQMTEMLNVPNPETSTPGDFADAAVEAGMEREDVDDLTTLFNEVRYGKRDPAAREERAIEIFRTIEAEYADGTDATREEGA